MSDYAKGFKDGFAAGLEEGKKLNQPQIGWPSTSPNLFLKETCPKCGIKIDGVMGYVCGSINCPIQYKATSGVVVGAVGSDNVGSNAVGANGPGSIFHHPV